MTAPAPFAAASLRHSIYPGDAAILLLLKWVRKQFFMFDHSWFYKNDDHADAYK